MIAYPSLQSLLIEMRYNGIATATGTAFTYAIGNKVFLITNRHNFTGRDNITGEQLSSDKPTPNEVKIFHHVREQPFSFIETVEPILNEDESPIWREHPTHGANLDLVALQLQQMERVAVHSMHVYDGTPQLALSPSDPISIIGYPFGIRPGGISPVWATGFIASEADIDYDGLPMFLVDCRARRGQSGSPVIAYRPSGMNSFGNGSIIATNQPITNFLGIYSGRINRESDLGMVWKANAVKETVLYAALNGG